MSYSGCLVLKRFEYNTTATVALYENSPEINCALIWHHIKNNGFDLTCKVHFTSLGAMELLIIFCVEVHQA